MKICIVGGGLVGLILAKILALKGLSVDVYNITKSTNYNRSRTIGIARSNIQYLEKIFANIKKTFWEINQIKIYTENFKNNEILNFSSPKNEIFSMVKNKEFLMVIRRDLFNNKLIKFKKNVSHKDVINKNYNLIINCDSQNYISKKYFSKRIIKNYNSFAYTTIINHKKLFNNKIAVQVFTKKGPIAFLPISAKQTSIVYSLRGNYFKNKNEIKKLIYKFNPRYEIIKIGNVSKFELNSSILRNYYVNNILAFGDLLHKIHPHAGQGLNMSIRDIRYLSKLIDKKLNLGLNIDSSICLDFEKKMQSKNFVFATGVDWIYEFFKFESKIKNEVISKSINILGKNKFFNSFFKKFADEGFINY